MYQKTNSHVLICEELGVICESIKVKYEYSLEQVPLISGGYYSKKIGKKWCELTVEGKIAKSDRKQYDSFFALVSGEPVTLIADITEYKKCVLVESCVTTLPDSEIDRFMMRFRSVDNG